MNRKKIFFLSFIFSALVPNLVLAASFNYTPMEKIPGFNTNGDFYSYISALYKFGIWAVGISAMLMIIIGGYMYMMSAGNNASMSRAKGVITDAVIGLILALTSYLILYEINPDLVRIKAIQPTQQGAVTVLPATGSNVCDGINSQVPSQCGDASPELQQLLSCVAGKLGNTVQISSISDSNGGVTCYSKYNLKCTSDPQSGCCYHARTSCHYGGTKCSDGSHAVDFSSRGSSASNSTIKAAIQGCGGRALDEGNHVHGSIGNCGCDTALN